MMRKEFDEDSLLTAQVPGKFKAVRLPYRSGNFSAIAVLPDSATTKPEPLLPILMPGSAGSSVFAPLGVGSRRYTPGKDSTWQRSGRLAVVMPRFKLRARMSLVDPLKKMGVQAAFSDSAADFSRADADPRAPFYVSDVVQEVCTLLHGVMVGQMGRSAWSCVDCKEHALTVRLIAFLG